jgi:steroid Delta-isomerase
MPSSDDIQRVFEQYAAAWSKHDLDGLMALFAPTAEVHDPVDGPVHGSVEAIRGWFGGIMDMVRVCKVAGPVHISGDCRHATASVYTEAAMGDDIRVIETADVMAFNDQGLITSLTAYWGPSNVHDASA